LPALVDINQGFFIVNNYRPGNLFLSPSKIFLALIVQNPLDQLKKPIFALAGIAIGVIAITAAAKAAILRNLNFVVAGLKTGGSVLAPQFQIQIGVQNPSSIDYIIRSMSGNVYVDDVLIGNASNFQEVTIKSNSQTIYIIVLRVGILQLAAEVLKIFSGQLSGVVKFTGTVNVENVPLPIDLTYNIL
jgi:hypothetical protein